MEDTIKSFDLVVNFDEDFTSDCDGSTRETSINLPYPKHQPLVFVADKKLDDANTIDSLLRDCTSEVHSELPLCNSKNVHLNKMETQMTQTDFCVHSDASQQTIGTSGSDCELNELSPQSSGLSSRNYQVSSPIVTALHTLPSDQKEEPKKQLDKFLSENCLIPNPKRLRRISSLPSGKETRMYFNADFEVEREDLRECLARRTVEAEVMSRQLMSMREQERIIKTRLDAIARNGSLKADTVISLKNTVASLYADVESLRCALSQSLDHQADLEEEIKSLKRSRDWHNEQLCITRTNCDRLLSENDDIRAMSKRNELLNHKLSHENACLRAQLACSQATLVGAKQSMTNQLEAIKVDMIEREAVFECLVSDRKPLESLNMDREVEIYELQTALSNAKVDLKVAEEQIELRSSRIVQLEISLKEAETRFTEIQNSLSYSLSERDFAVQQLRQQAEEHQLLLQKLDNFQDSLLKKDMAFSALVEEQASLVYALEGAQNEKFTLDKYLVKLKDNLSHVETSFYTLRSELEKRERDIDNLRDERTDKNAEVELLQGKLAECNYTIEVLNKECSELRKSSNMNSCHVSSPAAPINPAEVVDMVDSVVSQVNLNGDNRLGLVETDPDLVYSSTDQEPVANRPIEATSSANNAVCRTEMNINGTLAIATPVPNGRSSNESRKSHEHNCPYVSIDLSNLQSDISTLQFTKDTSVNSAASYFCKIPTDSTFADADYFSPDVAHIEEVNKSYQMSGRINQRLDVTCSQPSHLARSSRPFSPGPGVDHAGESLLTTAELGNVRIDSSYDKIEKESLLQAENATPERSFTHDAATTVSHVQELAETQKQLFHAQNQVQDLRKQYKELSIETVVTRRTTIATGIVEMEALKSIIKTTSQHLNELINALKELQKEKSAYQVELARLRGGLRAHLERFRLFAGIQRPSSEVSTAAVDLRVLERLLGESVALPLTCSKPIDGLNKFFESLQVEIGQLEQDVIHHALGLSDLIPHQVY